MSEAMKGNRSLKLEVRQSNSDAIRFYEKLGFRKNRIIPDFYQDEDALEMVLEINPNTKSI